LMLIYDARLASSQEDALLGPGFWQQRSLTSTPAAESQRLR
jgi:hypothetical protein